MNIQTKGISKELIKYLKSSNDYVMEAMDLLDKMIDCVANDKESSEEMLQRSSELTVLIEFTQALENNND